MRARTRNAVITIVLPSAMLLCGRLAFASEYYVAPGGSDDNPGTLASPLKTIQKAASIAVTGDTVLIRAGTYRETVVPAHSGSPGLPITFRSYNGEAVTVSGVDPVAGTWSQVNGSATYSVPLNATFSSTLNQADQLFVNGKMMMGARWPNTSPDNLSTPTKATVTGFVSKNAVTTGPDAGMFEWVFGADPIL